MGLHWKHLATVIDGEKFEIQGLNIWDFKWQNTNKVVKVKDPLYNKEFFFNAYRIQNSGIEVTFVAGEFSNCIWGIYLEEREKQI